MDRQTDTPDMHDRNEINKMNALDVLDVDTVYYPEAKEYGAFCNIESGARFSKALETFRARKAIAKSRTLRLQSCFVHIFLI